MKMIKAIRKVSWVLMIVGLWGGMQFLVNPLKFDWTFPNSIADCDTITAVVNNIEIKAGYKSDPGYFRFRIEKANNEYTISTIYQTLFKEAVEGNIEKSDTVTFWYTHGKKHKNQLWQIAKSGSIILPFSTALERFDKIHKMLLNSFGLMFLGLIGWVADKTKKQKKEEYKIAKRSSMGFMDFISPKLYFVVNKNKLQVQKIGSQNKIETKTHAHIDTNSNKIVAIGEENINEQGLIIKDGFGHDRVLIGDFDIAEQVLKFVIRRVLKSVSLLRPITIVHIKRQLAGGITEVEKRSVVDAFESAGSREVIIWDGEDFSEKELGDWNLLKLKFKK